MPPALSLWCDPQAVSDLDLLESIELANTNAAVGALCHPLITGERLERVAANANLGKVRERDGTRTRIAHSSRWPSVRHR